MRLLQYYKPSTYRCPRLGLLCDAFIAYQLGMGLLPTLGPEIDVTVLGIRLMRGTHGTMTEEESWQYTPALQPRIDANTLRHLHSELFHRISFACRSPWSLPAQIIEAIILTSGRMRVSASSPTCHSGTLSPRKTSKSGRSGICCLMSTSCY